VVIICFTAFVTLASRHTDYSCSSTVDLQIRHRLYNRRNQGRGGSCGSVLSILMRGSLILCSQTHILDMALHTVSCLENVCCRVSSADINLAYSQPFDESLSSVQAMGEYTTPTAMSRATVGAMYEEHQPLTPAYVSILKLRSP
jgi:hypothetical protein